ncbi:hypothetical protein OH687_18680 [Burkholderia anthina]|nr:hypothetical protein OH687_18680 [Burkholderia anthina]
MHAVGHSKVSLALNLAVELPGHPMAAAGRKATSTEISEEPFYRTACRN